MELVGLSGTFRQHTVATNKDGQLSGRVWLVDSSAKSKMGLADTKVFFVKDGDIVSQVYTDPDGTFDVNGLSEGAYSFIVSNVEGIAAYGVNVVNEGEAGEMEVVVVSDNAKKAQQLLDQENNATQSENLSSESVRGANVAQLIGGQLDGQLYSSFEDVNFSGSNVQVFNSEGKVVGQSSVDADGSFAVTGLESGYYEFVAEGPQGVAAFGFEAVTAEAAYTSTQDTTFNAMVTSPSDSYYVSDCATCGDVVYNSPVSEYASSVEYAGSCSSCAGAFSSVGGCGGGCGGFGGGGFGGGRLLPLVGLALGIVAIADDSGNDPGPATPANN